MLTEPVGPRSPEEILAVVYHRTERARRRRRQQLGGAAAVLAFAVTGLVSLRSGDDEASRVRVVDGNHVRSEDSTETSTPPTTAAAPADEGRATTSTTSASKARQQTSGHRSNGAGQAPTTTSPPPLPTTTTLPGPNTPEVRTLAQASDAEGDAVLRGWYYDIVSGSMQLDFENDVVVFTTRYATPEGSGDREDRTLRSEFEFEKDYVTVAVTETGNALGTVHLSSQQSTQPCSRCGKSFDTAAGLLTVTVPFDVMNDYLQRLYGNGKTIEQASDSVLHLVTVSAELGVKADETEGAQ